MNNSGVGGRTDTSRSVVAEYIALARKGKEMWLVVLGLTFNAFLITNLILKLSQMSISAIFTRIVEVYRDAIGFFFFPFEFTFNIEVPWYIEDLITIWIVSGQIGTIAFVLLSRLLFDQAAQILTKLRAPGVRENLIEALGQDHVNKETLFTEQQLDFHREIQEKWKLMSLAGLVTGPFMAILIWRHGTAMPGHRISGRGLLMVMFLLLSSMLIVYITLNFFTL